MRGKEWWRRALHKLWLVVMFGKLVADSRGQGRTPTAFLEGLSYKCELCGPHHQPMTLSLVTVTDTNCHADAQAPTAIS